MLAIAKRIVLEIAYPRPHHLLVEWHFTLRSCHLRKEGRERLYQVEESYWEVLARKLSQSLRGQIEIWPTCLEAGDVQPLILTERKTRHCPIAIKVLYRE